MELTPEHCRLHIKGQRIPKHKNLRALHLDIGFQVNI